MAITIKLIGNNLSWNGKVPEQEVDILADVESEITALSDTMTRGSKTFKVKPGSVAHTAGFGVMYEMGPSGVWKKIC